MTKKLTMLIAAFTIFGSLAWGTSYYGVVSDSMCGAKHSTASAAAAECVAKCVKGGSTYVLVSHGHVYKVDQQDKFAPYAGKYVRVTGTRSGDSITVSDVAAAHHRTRSTTSSAGTGS